MRMTTKIDIGIARKAHLVGFLAVIYVDFAKFDIFCAKKSVRKENNKVVHSFIFLCGLKRKAMSLRMMIKIKDEPCNM